MKSLCADFSKLQKLLMYTSQMFPKLQKTYVGH